MAPRQCTAAPRWRSNGAQPPSHSIGVEQLKVGARAAARRHGSGRSATWGHAPIGVVPAEASLRWPSALAAFGRIASGGRSLLGNHLVAIVARAFARRPFLLGRLVLLVAAAGGVGGGRWWRMLACSILFAPSRSALLPLSVAFRYSPSFNVVVPLRPCALSGRPPLEACIVRL